MQTWARRGDATDHHPHGLEIREPAALAAVVGVADMVPGHRALFADGTGTCHDASPVWRGSGTADQDIRPEAIVQPLAASVPGFRACYLRYPAVAHETTPRHRRRRLRGPVDGACGRAAGYKVIAAVLPDAVPPHEWQHGLEGDTVEIVSGNLATAAGVAAVSDSRPDAVVHSGRRRVERCGAARSGPGVAGQRRRNRPLFEALASRRQAPVHPRVQRRGLRRRATPDRSQNRRRSRRCRRMVRARSAPSVPP